MTNIAIEHGHRNSVFSLKKWWFSIAMLVYQRVIWMVNPNQFWATLCLETHYKRRRWLSDDFWCPVFPSLPVIKKGPKLPRRGSQLSVGMADAAFVADNHGAWLKFVPSSMLDEQWEVAAKTPEAVLSHRSCPWGGHLIKIDSKTLDTSRYCECTKQCCSVIFYVSFCDVSLTWSHIRYVQITTDHYRSLQIRRFATASRICFSASPSLRHPRSIFIQKAPENSCDVLVRPEVQATFEGDMEMTLRCLETHAPGDALIERTNSMWILRFAAEAWQGWWMVLSWRSVNSWDGWRIHQKDPQGQIDVYKLMIRGTLV